ncbi:MAG: hypothetical protein SFV81_21095, partial [Pirellulaceae bacterium]|nr:hypothetical protein [Pirellulaceae bacterium]
MSRQSPKSLRTSRNMYGIHNPGKDLVVRRMGSWECRRMDQDSANATQRREQLASIFAQGILRTLRRPAHRA